MPRGPKRLGLALGGGAARGIAHIGVLKVLDEEGVRPSFVSGTSAGSIIGALYAAGHGWSGILEVVHSIDWSDLVQPVFPKMGLLRSTKLEQRLSELLNSREIEDLEMPFCAVAVVLIAAEEFVFSAGNAARAVRASCSVPGVFEPVEIDDRVLVDGGVLNDVPVDVCLEMGADFVLGVDLNSDMLPDRRPENVVQVITASFDVLARRGRERDLGRREKDVVVVAPELAEFSYQDLKPIDELVQRGEEAMRKSMPSLLSAMKKRKIEFVSRQEG